VKDALDKLATTISRFLHSNGGTRGGAVRRPSRSATGGTVADRVPLHRAMAHLLLVFVAGAIVLAVYFSFTDYDLLSDPSLSALKN